MASNLNVLLFALGTAGDVYPAVSMGRALRRRGNRVVLAANSYFESSARRAGLEFCSTGTADHYLQRLNSPDLWTFGKGYKVLLKEIAAQIRTTYQIVAEFERQHDSVIVAPGSSLGARLAHEKLGVPLVTFHLQPLALRSAYPQTDSSRLPSRLVRTFRRMMLAGMDRFVLDPLVLPELNAFRRELKLAPLRRPFDNWLHSPQSVIGMFPEWFAPLAPDWPVQLRLTGFPLYDEADVQMPPEGLQDFLDSGTPPVVFVVGSGMTQAKRFFEQSVAACRTLDRRGILLTRFQNQVPENLPPSVRYFPYIPFSQVLPRSAALVHHGGIGTMAQAFRAGIPQLVTPFNFDQPDNAARLQRLGTGDCIRPRKYTAVTAAESLSRLLNSPAVMARCFEIRSSFRNLDPVADACTLIESVPRVRTAAASEAR